MGLIYRVNIQTVVNGSLLDIGTYNPEQLGDKIVNIIDGYCVQNIVSPLDSKSLVFEMFDSNDEPESISIQSIAAFQSIDYSGNTKKELIGMCKQRGISVPGSKPTNAVLIGLLDEDDKNNAINMRNDFGFKTSYEFSQLSENEQILYLDNIFVTPSGCDKETSDLYFSELEDVIRIYSGLSLPSKTVAKLDEIMMYINNNTDIVE